MTDAHTTKLDELYNKLEAVLNNCELTNGLNVSIKLLAGIIVQIAIKTNQPVEQVLDRTVAALRRYTYETAVLNIPTSGSVQH